jgi:hypothetical protein
LKSRTREECLKTAFYSLMYGYVDHAWEIIMGIPSLNLYVERKYQVAVERELSKVSMHLLRRYRRSRVNVITCWGKKLVKSG